MEWEESRIIELNSERCSQIAFTSFDGKKQEFTAAELEAEAKKAWPNPLIKNGTYFTISQVAAAGEDRNKWKFETVPPVGL